MKALICSNCNGKVNIGSYICAYCGTQYEKPSIDVPLQRLEIVRTEAPCVVLGAQMAVSEFHIREYPDIIQEHIRNNLARELANEIMKYMELEEDRDIGNLQRVFRARIRVVDGKHRFS